MITIGCDPELFLMDLGTGKPTSAFGHLPGSKDKPFKVKQGAVQVDGTAFEFNIEPAASLQEFLDNISSVTTIMKSMVETFDPKLQLVAVPTVVYEENYWKSLPKEATRLGCSADYSAYTGRENQPPETKEPFRTGAGHIHIGWTEDEKVLYESHFNDCILSTKQLDACLYIPSLLWDNDNKRRELYGRIGSFRPKHYGVEYRPLSNSWVTDPELMEFVYVVSKMAMDYLEEGEMIFDAPYIKEMVSQVLQGKEIPIEEAQVYLNTLYVEWGFPELPEEYGVAT